MSVISLSGLVISEYAYELRKVVCVRFQLWVWLPVTFFVVLTRLLTQGHTILSHTYIGYVYVRGGTLPLAMQHTHFPRMREVCCSVLTLLLRQSKAK